MNITLHYYAMLRETAERSTETVDSEASTVRDLFDELDSRYQFNVNPDRIRVAVNGTVGQWSDGLSDGDNVTFIPPTAGG